MLITHAKIWKIIGFLSLTNFWFFSISSFPCFLPQQGHSTREIKNERTQSLHLQCSSSVFELWCWRRLLRVPWTARRSNKSILKEISLECSLEELMLKLKLQYFGHLMRRVGSLEKTLMLGGIGGRRRRGWQSMRWLDGITDSMDVSLSELREFTQTHVHRVGDAIQPSHPLSSPSPLAPNPSQHQSLFQWVNSSHEMAKVLEFQL